MKVKKKVSIRDTMRSMAPGESITVNSRDASLEYARVQSSYLKKRENIVVKVTKLSHDKYELKREK